MIGKCENNSRISSAKLTSWRMLKNLSRNVGVYFDGEDRGGKAVSDWKSMKVKVSKELAHIILTIR
eukprot:m.266503 g.266503  ORF g.266503 m.266503 type:complete len:66 (+) comp67758_c0_seq1:291-488(+)